MEGGVEGVGEEQVRVEGEMKRKGGSEMLARKGGRKRGVGNVEWGRK